MAAPKSLAALLILSLVAYSSAYVSDLVSDVEYVLTLTSFKLPSLTPRQNKTLGPVFTTIFDPVINKIIYTNKWTGAAYNKLGNAECEGFDNANGVPLFNFLGRNVLTGKTNVDFGGDYACPDSCDGTCVSYPADQAVAPGSLYPFGCKCSADGCDANGPKMPTNWALQGTQVVCQRDSACTCAQVDPANPTQNYDGYLCSWWNVATNQTIVLQLESEYSLIRWCDCCPVA